MTGSTLHIVEFPDSISMEQLTAAFEALGLPMDRCQRVELRPDGYSASLIAEDLSGRIVGFVDVEVIRRPGS